MLGNNHADFTPYSVLIRLFEKLSNRKILCSFNAEGPSDETIADAAASTLRGLKQSQLLKQLVPEIQKLYRRDKKTGKLYLTKSAWAPIEEGVKSKFMPLLPAEMQNAGTLTTIVLDVFRENAYLEELKLFQLLSDLKIPFSGIETDTATYNQYMIASNGSAAAYRRNELMRIGYMVENVMNEALRRFPDGGIVVVFTGRNHAHRLVANLLNYVKTKQLDIANFDFHAFNLSSSYVKEWDENRDMAEELTASLDSDEINEIYRSLPCPTIECQEEGDSFVFAELEALVNQLIQDFEKVKATSSTAIFFPRAPHDQLVIDIKEYRKKNPKKVTDAFMAHIETNKNYSLALRNACSWGDAALVKLIVRYSDTLPIDFNQTSSNGKTPLAWFEASAANPAEKSEITALLKDAMGVDQTSDSPQINGQTLV